MGVGKEPGQKKGAARQHGRQPWQLGERELTRIVTLMIIECLRNRTEEKRRRQTFCDKRDNNFVGINFRQTSPFFKQIFL